MTPGASYLVILNRFARVGAVAVALVGIAVIIGWILHIPFLMSVGPGLATMKVNTACSFLVAGSALWILHTRPPGSPGVRLARGLAILVAALGALTLAQDLFAIDLHIDRFLLPAGPTVAGSLHPGRMAPATAINFILAGLALLVFKARRSGLAACTHWFAGFPLLVSTLAIIGYAYGVDSLYQVQGYSSMAVHTALSFFILTLSILAADSRYGLASLASSETAGGIMARRLLPTLPVLLFLLGWVRLEGQKMHLYDTNFGLALMVVLSIAVCVYAISSTALILRTVDIKRKEAETSILALNAGLEMRVQERTLELESTLAQVKRLRGLLPICAWCGKIRDDKDSWQSVEKYVTERTDARFSHSICPNCEARTLEAATP